MTTPPFALQTRVLIDRYRACMLGDLPTLVLLIAQAPFIGWLCTLVWGSVETDTPSLYFVLSLSAVWFGCINACREIVKERAIVERERLLGLSLPAYVVSRYAVLAGLGLIQVIALLVAVEWSIALRGPMLLQLIALWGASLCGTGLGLLVSAISSSQERAVGAVPLLILPQILFSEFAIPAESFSNAVSRIEKLMPARWCYEAFVELASVETAWGSVALSGAVLVGMMILLAAAAAAALLPRREFV
jgi:ABC transport system ATP-binding/permease protein